MFATALALAFAMTPQAGATRLETVLRVEAIVVRPPAMPTIRRRRHDLVIENPGAIAIAIDDEAPLAAASRTVSLATTGANLRRITLIF